MDHFREIRAPNWTLEAGPFSESEVMSRYIPPDITLANANTTDAEWLSFEVAEARQGETIIWICVNEMFQVYARRAVKNTSPISVGDEGRCYLDGTDVKLLTEKSFAKPEKLHWYEARGVRALDGDTIEALICINQALDLWISVFIRLFAINSEEMRSKDPEKRALAYQAQEKLNKLIKARALTLYLPGQRSFNRWLGWVFREDLPTPNLSDYMVEAGLAKYQDY